MCLFLNWKHGPRPNIKTAFPGAELFYKDKSRETVLSLKWEWLHWYDGAFILNRPPVNIDLNMAWQQDFIWANYDQGIPVSRNHEKKTNHRKLSQVSRTLVFRNISALSIVTWFIGIT